MAEPSGSVSLSELASDTLSETLPIADEIDAIVNGAKEEVF